MDSRIEDFFLQDSYLQQKIQELAQLESEIKEKSQPSPSIFGRISSNKEKLHSKKSIFDEQSLEERLGKREFFILTKVFVKFSGFKDYYNIKKLDHSIFHKLLEKAKIIGPDFTRIKADLIFFKGRKANFTDFFGFIRILLRIGQILYPTQEKYQSLSLLVNEKFNLCLNIKEEVEIYQVYHGLYIENTVQDIFNAKKGMLLIIFGLFKSENSAELFHVPTNLRVKKVGNKTLAVKRIVLKGFLTFLAAFEFVPKLLSGYAAAQVFRAVPCQVMFNESLSFEEFLEACFCLALTAFNYQENGHLVSLDLWFNYLETHPRALIENQNPLRNTVYTLKKNVDYS